jgi:hypothetical protein
MGDGGHGLYGQSSSPTGFSTTWAYASVIEGAKAHSQMALVEALVSLAPRSLSAWTAWWILSVQGDVACLHAGDPDVEVSDGMGNFSSITLQTSFFDPAVDSSYNMRRSNVCVERYQNFRKNQVRNIIYLSNGRGQFCHP